MILATHGIVGSISSGLPFEFTVKTDNAGVSTSTQFRMPLTTSTGLNINVDWGDGSAIENITVHTNAIHTYATAGTYTIKVTGSLLGWQFANGGDKLKMLNVASWGILIINQTSIFRGCTNLTSNALDAPNNITTLFEAFRDCPNFNGNISSWDVSQVSTFQSCFFGASSFNQNIGGWDVSNATVMTSMFRSFVGHAFNQNLGSWDVSNVQYMDNMFSGSNSFNNGGLDLIKNWDVSNIQFMTNMFESATAFNQDIGSWNVSNVTDFTGFMVGKTAADFSAANLDSIYNGWSLLTVNPNLSISFGSIKYTASGAAGKAILTGAPNNWTIVDGGI